MSHHGDLVGSQWSQYSNDSGQMYYFEMATGRSQYGIPAGWEGSSQVRAPVVTDSLVDTHALQDSWNYDATYQHWLAICY